MPKKPQDDYERWLAAAAAVEKTDNPLKSPYEVALNEAASVAAFVDEHWAPTAKRPGFKSVQKRLPEGIGEEIVSLIKAVQAAQTKLVLMVDPTAASKGDHARYLVGELESAIEFLLDDGVEEAADTQLVQLKEFHADDGQRSSALAQALHDYGTLAQMLKDRLVEIDEDFDPALIDEALALAKEMAEAGTKVAPATPAEVREVTDTRNRMLILLMDRVGQVRRAASRVFRNHPDLLRGVTSAYERRRRAAARRAKLAEEKNKGPKTGG